MTENVPFIIPLIVSSIHEWQNALPISDKILLFDINNTLYCSSRGFDDTLIEKINKYITKLGVQEKNHNLCEKYTKEYGLALLGIMKDFPETEPEDFYKHVEGSIDVSKYIGQDDELIKKFEALEGYKMYCFTNAHCRHALDVLNAMGITKFFSGIFHCNYDKKHPIIPKPDARVYELISGLFPESEIHFYDDSVVNVKAGKEIGWQSELIKPDYCIKKALQKFLTNEAHDNGEKKRQEDAMSLELGAESKTTKVSCTD